VSARLSLLVCAAIAQVANAAPDDKPGKPILVFESHTGTRPETIERVLAPLEDELETLGFAARPASILQIAGGRAPRPGILDPDKSAARIAQQVQRAYDDFVQARFRDAEVGLTTALRAIERNPALLVVDTSNADVTFKAMATLALCKQRLGDSAAAVATMTQLIRMFPSRPLPRADYGPDGEKFHRDVAKQVQAMGRGRLNVAGGNNQAVIFVDGQIRGIGKAALADLVPGPYRVFIQVPGTIGRQYEVAVTANDDAYLNVDVELDAALWASDSWVGFQFATDAERGKEARFAAELAKRWAGSELVAVVGPSVLRGRPAVIGTLYRSDGRVMRSAVIEGDDAASAQAARALARFLADGTVGSGLEIVRDNAAASAPPDTPPSGEAKDATAKPLYPKVLFVLGVAALAGGSVLFALDEDFTADAGRKTFDSAPAGVVIGAAGVAITAIGAILWIRSERSGAAPSSTPTATVTRGGATVGWSVRF
jgi:hypothetical protein